MDFVAEHMATVELYDRRGRVKQGLLSSFDALIAGSDQVWRSAYGDVKSYLFDFAPTDRIPKLSYAASFGTDPFTEYSPDLMVETKRLAQRLSAASVRETSAIQMCARLWDVRATQHIDPTMLLLPQHYSHLAKRSSDRQFKAKLLVYVLDMNSAMHALVEQVAEFCGCSPEVLLPSVPQDLREFRRTTQKFIKPSVYSWLRAFEDADFVLTDSFHGTVFSILNKKPFYCVENHGRGSSRFQSLLSQFGLEGRLLSGAHQLQFEPRDRGINWSLVHEHIQNQRARSLDYLRAHLPSVSCSHIQAATA